jgi:exodeoxyribonuclease VII small subunit
VAPRKKAPDFEKNLSQLESLVASLESGDLALEDALNAFENGIKITRECQAALTAAEQKVDILTRNSDGSIETQPFSVDEE